MADASPLNIVEPVTNEAMAPEISMVARKLVPDPGQVSLRDRPIMVQRGADFGEKQAPLQPLNTDGTSSGNRRVDADGVIRIVHEHQPGKHEKHVNRARVVKRKPLPPPVSTSSTAEAAAGEAKTAETLPPPAPTPEVEYEERSAPKIKVIMTGAGLPMKITSFFAEVHISSRLVVLVSVDDGETSIVEPPRTINDEDPLILGIGGKVYRCLCDDLSFETDTGLHLVLLRCDPELPDA
jgi:hypothetical protein